MTNKELTKRNKGRIICDDLGEHTIEYFHNDSVGEQSMVIKSSRGYEYVRLFALYKYKWKDSGKVCKIEDL